MVGRQELLGEEFFKHLRGELAHGLEEVVRSV